MPRDLAAAARLRGCEPSPTLSEACWPDSSPLTSTAFKPCEPRQTTSTASSRTARAVAHRSLLTSTAMQPHLRGSDRTSRSSLRRWPGPMGYRERSCAFWTVTGTSATWSACTTTRPARSGHGPAAARSCYAMSRATSNQRCSPAGLPSVRTSSVTDGSPSKRVTTVVSVPRLGAATASALLPTDLNSRGRSSSRSEPASPGSAAGRYAGPAPA